MLLKDLDGKSVCVLGYGREGKAMVKALEEYAPTCEITIADKNPDITVDERHRKQAGEAWLSNLGTFDVLIKSPGIPPSKELSKHRAKITNSTDIFLEEAASRSATVIGVTGSKGKSTTASLIHAILKAAGKSSFLVGNIGEPAIAHLQDIIPNTFFIQELSSYQLMDCSHSPSIAVITSFFPEHLDYHGSLDAYKEAKSHIVKFQSEQGFVVYDATSQGAQEIAERSPGRRIAAHAEDVPLSAAGMLLKGDHNRRNAAIAFLTTSLLGVPKHISILVIEQFRGLPHRLESLGIRNGIEWVDDAISTTPESTIAALDALGDRVATIILGGQDRGNDFSDLGKRIAESKIRTVILFPGSGPRIHEAIEKWNAHVECLEASTMLEAVTLANEQTNKQANAIVVLSTASPSYGMFTNFEEKGDAFRRCIETSHVAS